ncbi:hypothetical protein DL546_007056 [Coniochaeta pulveracea]|uniref:LysM domain-containing protein n=1 Tax=Coniochaeta pulveracea TaxID=177199 RepID=A0A420YI35_9PEZI|nr:hypothetical protein DL546_007056 [Coniochaeta pulveracea]
MPMANGTTNDCSIYLDPPVLLNVTAGTTSTECSDVAAAYGVTVGNLQEWNPSLGNSSSCSLSVKSRYCVLRFVNAALNVTSACIQREVAAPGYDCDQFAGSWGIETEQFIAWNPAVGPGCANYKLGAQYCVAVYGFRQPGLVANCNKFAMPNTTSWINRPCEIMETTFGLQHARFVAWNPAVKDNCAGIYPLYEYCVSIPNFKPTYTTPATQPPPTGRPPTVVPIESFSR